MNPSHRLNELLLRWNLCDILSALSFLHEEAEVTHAGKSPITNLVLWLMKVDTNPTNIMFTIADESILEDIKESKAENRLPRKIVDDTCTIYSSHKLGFPRDSLWGETVLSDFGEARIGKYHKGLIQPELYRAPEVLFGMEWDSSVDIWSVATLVSVKPIVPIFAS